MRKTQQTTLEGGLRRLVDGLTAETLEPKKHWDELFATAERCGAKRIERDENGQPIPAKSWMERLSSVGSTLSTAYNAASTASRLYGMVRPFL